MSRFEDYSREEIAVVSLERAMNVSAFPDQDIQEIAKPFAERLIKRGLADADISTQLEEAIQSANAAMPRSFTVGLSKKLSMLDQMQAFRKMPASLVEAFGDSDRAVIDSQQLFTDYVESKKDPAIAPIFISPSRSARGKRLQYCQITIPEGAGDLAQRFQEALLSIGHHAVLETSGHGHERLHYFNYDTTVTQSYHAAADKLSTASANARPFTLGSTYMMMTPIAWVILRGLASRYDFRNVVQAGNAARAHRPGTKPLRQMVRIWERAADLYYRHPDPFIRPGSDDEPLIPTDPSERDISDVRAYVKSFSAKAWDPLNSSGAASQMKGGIHGLIEQCPKVRKIDEIEEEED